MEGHKSWGIDELSKQRLNMKCRPNRCLLLAVVFVLATGGSATASSLMEAATKGDSEKVQALLEKGANVNEGTSIYCCFRELSETFEDCY